MTKRIALVLLLPVLAWCIPASPANSSRVEQKRAAESEHSELRKKLSELKQDIHNTESAKHRAENALVGSEAAISDANRKLAELDKRRQQTGQKLAELSQQYQELQQRIERQKIQFSNLLRQQYEKGGTDRIKLILSGDNPNNINRDLHYLGYLSKSENKLIYQLRGNLAAVHENKLAMEQAGQDLADIASGQQQQKSNLVKEKQKRADLIKQLSNKLSVQRKEVGQLQKNEQRLGNLVKNLNTIIEAQRKAARLVAKKRAKLEAAARARAKARTARPGSKIIAKQTTKPIQITQTPELNHDIDSGQNQFARLKGRLRLPVKGELTAKFGSLRGEGTRWKGLFIHASEGENIKSIAPGKVIFADWLRGFGNLIILDHGAQYMSIYGNNQRVLKQPGDQVHAGEVIALAGNSGGNEQSGLYFELRFKGKAFDPLRWISLN